VPTNTAANTAAILSEDQLPSARPFVKWAGGKRQILSELMSRIPNTFGRYFEPMLGGGALYFALQPKSAVLNDTNQELINVFNTVRGNVDALIGNLKQHQHSEDYYYALRAKDQSKEYDKWTNVEKASRFIYLNKTCFNGLYRVNSKGFYNVPFGDYKNPKIVDEENLRAGALLLRSAKITCGSYLEVEAKASSGDFVYIDPPYLPISKTSSFTSYTKDGFSIDDHFELSALCQRLDKKGVQFMVSNSFTHVVLGAFKNFKTELIKANRAINSKASGRGKITELIITNY